MLLLKSMQLFCFLLVYSTQTVTLVAQVYPAACCSKSSCELFLMTELEIWVGRAVVTAAETVYRAKSW